MLKAARFCAILHTWSIHTRDSVSNKVSHLQVSAAAAFLHMGYVTELKILRIRIQAAVSFMHMTCEDNKNVESMSR